ncbi:hypothetical protein PVK06_043469 [Gossypium arboreum]|uniref:RNase H type-1 domain-containing protein n=1 Tax=Gossypium arboreum TaxID=29729 RepID=A0ABR0MNT9_GOSAR|nr:hypothetical protein PVK06_043469 [Gossypium arboreum]
MTEMSKTVAERCYESISAPIKEIKARANSFELIEFRFIPCQGNRAVHLLAEEGRRRGAPRLWIEKASRVVEVEVERGRRAMQDRN